jgi:hypothetical protein
VEGQTATVPSIFFLHYTLFIALLWTLAQVFSSGFLSIPCPHGPSRPSAPSVWWVDSDHIISLHGVTSQNTVVVTVAALRTSSRKYRCLKAQKVWWKQWTVFTLAICDRVSLAFRIIAYSGSFRLANLRNQTHFLFSLLCWFPSNFLLANAT